MKKLTLLFLFFPFVNLFSQEYHFDYSIETHTDRIKPSKEKTITTSFYDSKNKVYLRLVKYNDKLRATIYEEDKHFRHSFKVTESKEAVTFEYTHTNDFSKSRHQNYAKNDILEVNKIDSLKYQINVFKNNKRKKKRAEGWVTLEKSKFNYIEIGMEYYRSNEIVEKIKEFLDPNSNYIVKNIRLDYSMGYSSDTSLKIHSVDFSLKIPEKLIMKEFDFFREFQD